MKALWRDHVVAEASDDELIRVEGAWYFPPSAVDHDLLVESPTPYTCSWRGEIQYYSLRADGVTEPDAAWCYPSMPQEAIDRIGLDARRYIAFSPTVTLA